MNSDLDQEKHTLIEDLEALNQIAAVLNQAVDVRSALERSLAQLIELAGLETGWIFVRDQSDHSRWWGPGFTLVAHHNLPPALSLDSAEAWDHSCDCQGLCLSGRLTEAYNEVRCSRLSHVSGDRRGLVVHASAPLRAGERTLGILNVAAPNWESFSPRILALLSNVGAQIGAALERARLFDMLQERRIHEQAALLDFTNQLLGRLDLDDLIDYLVSAVRTLLQVDACALVLPDEEDPSYLRFCAASGWLSDPVRAERRIPADMRSGSGRVMQKQEPVVIHEVDRQKTTLWMADWLPQEAFRAAAIVPLVAGGRSIGAMVVHARQPRKLEESELRFLQLMGNQAAIALETARLHREEIQRHRLEEELAVGRQIQLSMLPEGNPALPGWEFAAHYEAARQVGGDFYDYFRMRRGDGSITLAVIIADVADKGVPAALFMALSRTTIRNVAADSDSPAAALMKANELILEDSQAELFLTAFYAVFTPGSGNLVYTNAGHNPPLWYRNESDDFRLLNADGIALGVIADIALQDVVVEVAPGDVLVFYTDGVTEAMNEQMGEFGLHRLQETVARVADDSAAGIVEAILAAVDDFRGGVSYRDDLTLVVLKRAST